MNAELTRDELHRLVDELPEGQLAAARRALEGVKQAPAASPASDRRDIDIINANADELNAEAEDVLGYQADW